MEHDIHRAVRDACLWLPEAEEGKSHGMSSFKVRGKIFAYFVVNHHGDGRVALWVSAGHAAQEACVSADRGRFFVPPYLGSRGWLGIELNKRLAWTRIAVLVREAYERVAPGSVAAGLGKTPRIEEPASAPSAADIDPLRTARGKAVLKLLRKICLDLPESREAVQFGCPVWQAGRRTFAWARCESGRLEACFWVGVDRQLLLTLDPRFRIPPYLGHNGWIAVDVHDDCDADELDGLARQSYRHFALKRMLRDLEGRGAMG